MEAKIIQNKEKVDSKYRKVQFAIVFGIVMILVSILLNSPLFFAIGLFMLLLFGLSLYDFKRKNLHSIVLNEKGILDNTGWISFGLIEWKDILNLRIDEKFENLILIDVNNENKYLDKLNVNKRFGPSYKMQLKNNSFGYGTVVFLNVKNLNEHRDIIFEKIQKHMVFYI